MATMDDRFFIAAIEGAVKARVKEVAEEEAAEASKRVAKRVNEEIDRIALSVLSEYSVTTDGRILHISVRKS